MNVRHFARLPVAFWWVVGIGCLIALSRFSQAFLLLKARNVGANMSLVPVYLALMGLVPRDRGISLRNAGRSHRPPAQLGIGGATLVACHLTLAGAQTNLFVAIGAVLWGLQLGIIGDGLLGAKRGRRRTAGSARHRVRRRRFRDRHRLAGRQRVGRRLMGRGRRLGDVHGGSGACEPRRVLGVRRVIETARRVAVLKVARSRPSPTRAAAFPITACPCVNGPCRPRCGSPVRHPSS